MEPEVLLAQLRALLERMPDFEQYSPFSREHALWLGQAHALVDRWDKVQAIMLQVAADTLPMELMRASNVATISGVLHRAIADLELKVPGKGKVAFAAGEVYEFFQELNKVIASSEKSIFIVDPYLDATVFDYYLNSRGTGVTVRLLLSKNSENVKAAAEKYAQQYATVLEVRKSNKIHDRVIFLDGYVCWIVGQSLKDAAKAKPTYLAPLAPDVVATKLEHYESIWANAQAI
ncbi:MAG: hypothetical protein MUC77_07645 [Chromatiaceae bacterium]|jgi:hypothetical protein|nr:hypothetical protein [Chromatiaceae bacterium]